MANNPLPYNTPVITAVNAFTALLNTGFLNIYTGSQPALNGSITGSLLVSLTFQGTAFPTAVASGGVVTATANALGSAVATGSGTAGYFALMESNGTTVVLTGSVGLSGADLNMTTLTISFGGTVSSSGFTITMNQT